MTQNNIETGLKAPQGPKVDIVGGGVSGLNTGIEALKSGKQVRIFEAEPYNPSLAEHPEQQRITRRASDAGSAQWYPYVEEELNKGEQGDQLQWIEDALNSYLEREIIEGYRGSMARRRNIELMKDPEPVPDYLREMLEKFGPVKEFGGIPKNPLEYSYGYDFTTLAINSPAMLTALRQEFKELGGNFVSKRIESADEFYELAGDVLVNCTGLGSAELFPDTGLEAVKGHILFYKNPGVDTIVSAEDLIILPRSDNILAVGCLYLHEGEYNTDDPTIPEAQDLVKRINQMIGIDIKEFDQLQDQLKKAEFMGETSGFRPYRKAGTLVAATSGPNDKIVVHNVGHGGMGWTLAGTGKAALREINSAV